MSINQVFSFSNLRRYLVYSTGFSAVRMLPETATPDKPVSFNGRISPAVMPPIATIGIVILPSRQFSIMTLYPSKSKIVLSFFLV